MAFEGVHESLKQHFSRVWDFGHDIMKINLNNILKITGTKVNDGDVNRFQNVYLLLCIKEGMKSRLRASEWNVWLFLKTVCGGPLPSAVGKDDNNHM